jgi:hypothetical protein
VTMYGLYIRDLAEGDMVWFTTDKALEPGTYQLKGHRIPLPDVYVSESIPARILWVGPIIDQVEESTQSSLSPTDMFPNTEQHIAFEMTEGLLQNLTVTSSSWVANPDWVDNLRPVSMRRD